MRDVRPGRLVDDLRDALLDQRGAVRARYSPPPGFFLIDFAQHASGEITVALATARTVTLVRLDRAAAVSTEFPLLDPQAARMSATVVDPEPGGPSSATVLPRWIPPAGRS